MLKPAAWFVSALAHGALVLALVYLAEEQALRSGAGTDQLAIEQGIAIESFEIEGPDKMNVAAVDTPPARLSEARPPMERVEAEPLVEELPPKVEAAERPEKTEIIRSTEGPEQEAIEPEEPEKERVEEKPTPEQAPAPELAQEDPVEGTRGAGPKQTGGDATILSAYHGKLRAHLGRNKVSPRSRLTGTVVVRFTVSASGELLSREVTKSSGHRVLDEAATASLDRAAPFPPFSEGMSGEPMVIVVPFRFVVK